MNICCRKSKNLSPSIHGFWLLSCLISYCTWLPPYSLFQKFLWISSIATYIGLYMHPPYQITGTTYYQTKSYELLLSILIGVGIIICLHLSLLQSALCILAIDIIFISCTPLVLHNAIWVISFCYHFAIIALYITLYDLHPQLLGPLSMGKTFITYFMALSSAALLQIIYYLAWIDPEISPLKNSSDVQNPQTAINSRTSPQIYSQKTVGVATIDLVNFKHAMNTMNNEMIVNWLHDIFTYADHLTNELSLKKIKLMGDAYLVASLTPETHISLITLFIKIQEWLDQFSMTVNCPLKLHAGASIGPVITGKIGLLDPQYDIWGYTVNRAHQLCSHASERVMLIDDLFYLQLSKTKENSYMLSSLEPISNSIYKLYVPTLDIPTLTQDMH